MRSSIRESKVATSALYQLPVYLISMTWAVTLTGKAYKQLKKLPLDIQDLADAAVHALEAKGLKPKG